MTVIIIPDVPPSLNKILRMHWAEKRKLGVLWGWKLRAKLPSYSVIPKVKMRCQIVLHHARLYDKDNAYGGCKLLIDQLKAIRAIKDDSAEWLELEVRQVKCSHKDRHTTVLLEEL